VDAAHLALTKGAKIPSKLFHQRLGHVSNEITTATAKYMGLDLTGTLKKCEDCAMGKMKKIDIPKGPNLKSTVAGERLYTDIASIKAKSASGKHYWAIFVDEATDQCWSLYLVQKSDLAKEAINLLKEIIHTYKKLVKFI
jgi:hypothetical protein